MKELLFCVSCIVSAVRQDVMWQTCWDLLVDLIIDEADSAVPRLDNRERNKNH